MNSLSIPGEVSSHFNRPLIHYTTCCPQAVDGQQKVTKLNLYPVSLLCINIVVRVFPNVHLRIYHRQMSWVCLLFFHSFLFLRPTSVWWWPWRRCIDSCHFVCWKTIYICSVQISSSIVRCSMTTNPVWLWADDLQRSRRLDDDHTTRSATVYLEFDYKPNHPLQMT